MAVGHALQGVCLVGDVHGRWACVAGCVCGGGCAWQRVHGRDMHGKGCMGGMRGRGVCGIRSMSGRYASYWNAFLFLKLMFIYYIDKITW